MTASAGVYAGWVFLGRIAERSPSRLIRHSSLESRRAGVLPVETDEQGYARAVTHLLAAGTDGTTTLTSQAVTVIPGLPAAAAKAGGQAEQHAVDRSLERLRAEITGARPGLLRRFRDSGQTPALL